MDGEGQEAQLVCLAPPFLPFQAPFSASHSSLVFPKTYTALSRFPMKKPSETLRTSRLGHRHQDLTILYYNCILTSLSKTAK